VRIIGKSKNTVTALSARSARMLSASGVSPKPMIGES